MLKRYLLVLFALCTVVLGHTQNFTLLKDIAPGNSSGVSYHPKMVQLNNKIYFGGDQAAWQYFLYRTDGTASGTSMVSNLAREVQYLTLIGDQILFTGMVQDGEGLFKMNGANEQVSLVKKFPNSEVFEIHPIGASKVLFWVAPSGQPTQLWASDGTAAGTVQLGEYEFWEDNLIVSEFQGKAILSDLNDDIEAVITDGTPAGTQLLKNYLAPLATISRVYSAVGNGEYLFVDGALISGGTSAKSIVTDGTPAGTHNISLGYTCRKAMQVGEVLLLFTDYKVFSYNPTTHVFGTFLAEVKSSTDPLQIGDKLYFHGANHYVWVTDGTQAGTQQISTESAGVSNNHPRLWSFGPYLVYSQFGSGTSLRVIDLVQNTDLPVTTVSPNNGLVVIPSVFLLNGKYLIPRFVAGFAYEWWYLDPNTSDTQDAAIEEHVALTPNPSNGFCTLRLPAPATQEAELRVFDGTARLIVRKTIPAGTQTIELDLTVTAPGLVSVVLTEGVQTRTFRLVRQ